MCIIIDINTLAPVFNRICKEHHEFKPVHDWIINGRGKFVYGGSKYKRELKTAKKYFTIMILLKDINKVVEIEGGRIDQKQQELESKYSDSPFNDSHIAAIAIISGCKLLCSKDSSSYNLIKNKTIYPSNMKKVKIYSGLRNKRILNDSNIAKCCKPCSKLTRKQRESF